MQQTKRITKRKLRACLSCSLLKTSAEFRSNGCENCPFFNMKKNLNDCTSDNYKGMIFIVDTNKSWVAKWQRVKGFVKGNYAILVYGYLPEEFIERMEDEGREFIPRDKPFSIG